VTQQCLVLEDLVTLDGELTQLSAVISETGAPQQTRHSDTNLTGVHNPGCLFTLLIALEEVTLDMGPTLIWGGTHTPAFHALSQHEKACVLDQIEPHHATLQPGEAVLYSSLVFHCGGANVSNRSRTLLSLPES